MTTGKEKALEALASNRAATQFGGERANPQSQNANSNKPWSIRNSVRYYAAQRIDIEDKNALKKLTKKNPTISENIAMAALAKAMKGDMRAIEYTTDQIDGKLAQPNINADLAAIQEMSDAELYEQFKQIQSAIESLAIDSNGLESGDGDTAEGGSAESTEIEDEHAGQTPDTESV